MTTHISRRWFVAAIGGVAGLASATMAWRLQRGQTERPPIAHVGNTLGVVDHDGWILTPADQQRFIQATAAPAVHGQDAGSRGAGDR